MKPFSESIEKVAREAEAAAEQAEAAARRAQEAVKGHDNIQTPEVHSAAGEAIDYAVKAREAAGAARRAIENGNGVAKIYARLREQRREGERTNGAV